MRRLSTVLLGAALVAALAVPANAGIRTTYTRAYYLARNHAHADVGRNIRRDGLRDGVTAARRHYRKSIAVLKGMIHPAPTPSHASATAGNGGGGGGGGGTPPESIAQCESGGSYTAVNPTSGARGKWQLLPSTYAANGGDGSWSPADQDRVAARVWAGGAGAGQWVCKG